MIASHVSDLKNMLDTTLQSMLNSAMLSTELMRYAMDLQQFGVALQISLECQALQRTGHNLDLAGLLLDGLDLQFQQTFDEMRFSGFEPHVQPGEQTTNPLVKGLLLAGQQTQLEQSGLATGTTGFTPDTTAAQMLQGASQQIPTVVSGVESDPTFVPSPTLSTTPQVYTAGIQSSLTPHPSGAQGVSPQGQEPSSDPTLQESHAEIVLLEDAKANELSAPFLYLCRWQTADWMAFFSLRHLTDCDALASSLYPPQLSLALCRRVLDVSPSIEVAARGSGLWRLGLETFSLSSGQLLSSFWPDLLSLPIRSTSFSSDDFIEHYLPSLSLAPAPSDPTGSPSCFAALSLLPKAPSNPGHSLSRPATPLQGVGSLFWLSSSLSPLASLPWLGAHPSLVSVGPSLFGSDLQPDSWRLWHWLPSSSPPSWQILDSFPADPSSFLSLVAPPPAHFWSLLIHPDHLLVSLRRSSNGSLVDSLILPDLRPPFPNPRSLPALAPSDPDGSLSLVEVLPS